MTDFSTVPLRTRIPRRLPVLLGAVLLGAAGLHPATGAAAGKPPALTRAQLYARHCARCHGGRGEGKDGPALRKLKAAAAEIAETVRKGIPGDMPAFSGILTPSQIQGVAHYARALQSPVAARPAAPHP